MVSIYQGLFRIGRRAVWSGLPLCKHLSDWLGQDAHPHPIYSHKGDYIFFNSRSEKDVKVYCVAVNPKQ